MILIFTAPFSYELQFWHFRLLSSVPLFYAHGNTTLYRLAIIYLSAYFVLDMNLI